MMERGARAWYRRKRTLLLLLAAVLLILYVDRALLGKLMYPIKYESIIEEQAAAHGVDPYLIAAIIRVESNFATGKRSPKGAMGLMQLMPPTAEWIAKQEGNELDSVERLKDPELNIRYGAWYLASLRRQFAGPELLEEDAVVRVAAAYNAGPGNVERWLAERQWDGTWSDANRIPFGETRHYVHRIRYYYVKYAQTYPDLSGRDR